MQSNSLINTIFSILEDSPEGLSEYALIRRLVDDKQTDINQISGQGLALFTQHFMVMNALYQLQDQLLSTGLHLSISALSIKLYEVTDNSEIQSLELNGENELSTYYLDWNNLRNTEEDDVEALLNGFWSRYLALNDRETSLAQLGLPNSANWEEIKTSYRKLIAQFHPDRGGDEQRFVQIRLAYESLAKIYRISSTRCCN